MIQKLLFLLRYALWGGKPKDPISAKSFLEILKLAKGQTILGLVFDVLKDVKVEGTLNKSLVFETIGFAEQIKLQNTKINKELISFAQSSQKYGLNYVVVKGQTIGCLYTNPQLRAAGDIDFLVPDISSQLSEVFPGIKFPATLKEKELGFEYNNIPYELHLRLTDFGCKKHQRIWENVISEEWIKEYYVEIDRVKVRTLSPTTNAVYLFLHLFFHIIREGVSLRQLCDWAVMLHHYRNEIDKDTLENILQQLDMIKGYKAFGTILVDELGLPEEEFPLPLAEEDRGMKKKILEDIFQGGNFGKHNHKAKSALGFKMETFRMALNNSIHYHSLAPSEMRMMIPKMLRINLRLLFG